MKKILITIYFFIFVSNFLLCQDKFGGYWTGTLIREDSEINISFEFKYDGNVIKGFYNSPKQKALGIPLDNVKIKNDSLWFSLMSEPVTDFKCVSNKENIYGKFFQEGFSEGVIKLKKSEKPVKKYSSIDTAFYNGDVKISCRIYFPESSGNYPSLVFLHGSGSEGMFANQYFAEYLASKGIITLIQDKRGVGKSTGDWTKISFDNLTDDYIKAVEFLKSFKGVDENKIGIYGHSQGGTLAPFVGYKSHSISYIIAAASIGDFVYKQDLYRVENILKNEGFKEKEITEAMSYYKFWLDIARTGEGSEKLDSVNNISKGKSWFEWVEAPAKEHWIWSYYRGVGNYNSLDYWSKIEVPVLLVYGEKDAIEDINNYMNNISDALKKNKDVMEIVLPGAQHNLCIFPEKNEKFFWWHLYSGFEDTLSVWILNRFK